MGVSVWKALDEEYVVPERGYTMDAHGFVPEILHSASLVGKSDMLEEGSYPYVESIYDWMRKLTIPAAVSRWFKRAIGWNSGDSKKLLGELGDIRDF